jgi:putative transposase
VEAIVAETIRKRFLSRQKRSIAVIHREIRQACVAQGLLAPSRNTVAARIDRLRPAKVARGPGRTGCRPPVAVRR